MKMILLILRDKVPFAKSCHKGGQILQSINSVLSSFFSLATYEILDKLK